MEQRKKNRQEAELEVEAIVQMYACIQISLNSITKEETRRLGHAAGVNPHYFWFEGFDATNQFGEKHFSILSKWVAEGKYPELKDKYLMSHNSLVIVAYRKMLAYYDGINTPSRLTVEQLTELVKFQKAYSDNPNLTSSPEQQ